MPNRDPGPGPGSVTPLLRLAHLAMAAATEHLSRGYAALVAAFAAAPAPPPAEPPRELAAAAERQAEAAMRARIRREYPGHAIAGEVLGAAGDCEWLWALDALDGTGALLRTARAEAFGSAPADPAPAFGVTVAVVHRDRPVAGVVGQLRPGAGGLGLSRVWSGAAGQPTTCDGAPVFPGSAAGLAHATMATTAPEVMFGTRASWSSFQALRERTAALVAEQNCVGFMRLLGGGVEIAAERDLALPDAAALVPVLRGAGVVVTDHDGRPPRFDAGARDGEYALLAAPPALHGAALTVLRAGVADDRNTFALGPAPRGYRRKFG
ncbi:inositol monophosphatase family protein [Dactylosporangium sp. AC04546]|uniref:inositol monophosphatase family protein n=1 Tax=Dactylosporangium sp. AC04546 TaxID=2862460 RepID=UPI001EDDF3B3|nr:inositol monophosphatase family protein [Dactylosporangium sp. AC04546]WVK89044.1 inositol monophosphatase family protein [Dactylosporangium sp. AC04546]